MSLLNWFYPHSKIGISIIAMKKLKLTNYLPIGIILLLTVTSSPDAFAQQSIDPSPAQAHTIFLPLVSVDNELSAKAMEVVANRTNTPQSALSIVDSFMIEYPLLQKVLYSFSISNIQGENRFTVTLDENGFEVDREQLDKEEAAVYSSIGDYVVDVPIEPSTEEFVDVTTAALGSGFIPYYLQQHEYRVSSTGRVCLAGGIIGLQLVPSNSRTNSAQLKVIVSKCNGTAFSQSGRWELLINGVKRYSQSYTAGRTSYELIIKPLKETWYDTKQSYQYQIKLFSNDAPTAPKYSGALTAAVWGRCWCTDYVYQTLRLTGGYPNARDWGSYLTRQGFRQLGTTETPRAGDVVVFPNANHVAILISKSSAGIKVKQGGSVTTNWYAENYCYNKREETWSISNIVAYYRR